MTRSVPQRGSARAVAGRSTRTVAQYRHFIFNRRSQLNLNHLIRQTHRWLSIAFTLAVIITTVVLTRANPPVWVSYLALPPLFLLLLTGLYLFVLPYVIKWRGGRRTN